MVPRGVGVIQFSLSDKRDINRTTIGQDKHPLIIVDGFLENPEDLITNAGQLNDFSSDDGNFYPGVRKPTPAAYISCLTTFLEQFLGASCDVLTSMFSIVNQDPNTLKPVQSIPHFDTSNKNQLGVVHYLCGPEQGGTSFYRHKATGFERITDERKSRYLRTLERQATTSGLPKPGYIDGETDLFERFAKVDAKFNRLIIYPSNLLHTGDILKVDTQNQDITSLRLTTTNFVRVF